MADEVSGRDFGRVEGKLDQLAEMIREHAREVRNSHEKIENRLTDLENARNQSIGRHSVLATIAGLISGGVSSWIMSHLR